MPLAPHSWTFNGGEDIKAIRQHSYSPNTTTADFFLFQRDDVEAGRPLTVQGGLLTNSEGVVRTSNKNESAAAFWRGWAAANSTSESALNRPKNS